MILLCGLCVDTHGENIHQSSFQTNWRQYCRAWCRYMICLLCYSSLSEQSRIRIFILVFIRNCIEGKEWFHAGRLAIQDISVWYFLTLQFLLFSAVQRYVQENRILSRNCFCCHSMFWYGSQPVIFLGILAVIFYGNNVVYGGVMSYDLFSKIRWKKRSHVNIFFYVATGHRTRAKSVCFRPEFSAMQLEMFHKTLLKCFMKRFSLINVLLA